MPNKGRIDDQIAKPRYEVDTVQPKVGKIIVRMTDIAAVFI